MFFHTCDLEVLGLEVAVVIRVTVGGLFSSQGPNGIGVYGCSAGDGCSTATGPPIGGEFYSHGLGAVGVHVSAGAIEGQGSPIGVESGAGGSGARAGLFTSFGSGSGSVGVEGDYFGGAALGTGVLGKTNATAAGQIGVSGQATGTDGIGVQGVANSGPNAIGVHGASSSGFAGRFDGNVQMVGSLTREYGGAQKQATPVAYAAINNGGSVLPNASTPNVTATFDSVNKRYVITISGETYDINRYVTEVTPISSVPRFAATNSSGGHLLVRFFDLAGAQVQSAFSFITYKP
jgi:hypothetical protein